MKSKRVFGDTLALGIAKSKIIPTITARSRNLDRELALHTDTPERAYRRCSLRLAKKHNLLVLEDRVAIGLCAINDRIFGIFLCLDSKSMGMAPVYFTPHSIQRLIQTLRTDDVNVITNHLKKVTMVLFGEVLGKQRLNEELSEQLVVHVPERDGQRAYEARAVVTNNEPTGFSAYEVRTFVAVEAGGKTTRVTAEMARKYGRLSMNQNTGKWEPSTPLHERLDDEE